MLSEKVPPVRAGVLCSETPDEKPFTRSPKNKVEWAKIRVSQFLRQYSELKRVGRGAKNVFDDYQSRQNTKLRSVSRMGMTCHTYTASAYLPTKQHV